MQLPSTEPPSQQAQTASINGLNADDCDVAAPTVEFEDVPRATAIGDWNADGKLDIATAPAKNSDKVHILLGCGNGAFRRGPDQRTSLDAETIVSTDLNGDQRQDLVTANYTEIGVLLAQGDGTFAPPLTYPTVRGVPSLASADFNADGVPDVAVANSNEVRILLGAGDGTLGTSVTYSMTDYSQLLVAVDVNEDAAVDLLIPPIQEILMGNGDGTFTASSSNGLPYYLMPDAYTAAIGDFTEDGNLAIILGTLDDNGAPGGTTILSGQNLARQRVGIPAAGFPVIPPASELRAGDVDNDGDVDLVALYPDNVTVYLREYGALKTTVVSTSTGGQSCELGDANGDGIVDIAGISQNSAFVLLGSGDGTFHFYNPTPAASNSDG